MLHRLRMEKSKDSHSKIFSAVAHCDLLKLWCQLLPCSTKHTWQSINSPGADTADKTVNLTFDPLIVFLLHITLKVFAVNFTHIAIDDGLIKIYQAHVQMPLDYKFRPSYQQQLCGNAVPYP